jgi:predicted transglutaminase-like cysteine proteinase
MIRNITLAVSVAALLFSPLGASAAPLGELSRTIGPPTSALYLSLKGPTLAPFAQIRFCVQNPADCKVVTGDAVVTMTAAKRAELQKVNLSVNRSILPINDRSGPMGDIWEADVTSGDCEDFALTKRRKLMALGWPANALRIAVARTRAGEGHAVLVVTTSEGDLVLDNRMGRINSFRKTGLSWIKIQSGENPRLWFAL